MDLHRGGGFTQGRWIYTGAVDLHRGGGAVGGGGFTQGRWIYIGAVGRWGGGFTLGRLGRWALDGRAVGGGFTKCLTEHTKTPSGSNYSALSGILISLRNESFS